jgi:hypothetical protein
MLFCCEFRLALMLGTTVSCFDDVRPLTSPADTYLTRVNLPPHGCGPAHQSKSIQQSQLEIPDST